MGLLDHLATRFLVSWGTSALFCIVAASIYIPTHRVRGFPILHSLSDGHSAWCEVVVVQSLSRVWLCSHMDCSTPDFPVLHHLPETTQTHVHWVSNAIQPSHPLSSPSPPAFSLPSIRIFCSASALGIRWPEYWNFSFSNGSSNEYWGLISFKINWFDLLADSGVFFSTIG